MPLETIRMQGELHHFQVQMPTQPVALLQMDQTERREQVKLPIRVHLVPCHIFGHADTQHKQEII